MPMTRDEAMEKIAEAAEGETLIGLGPKLKEIFGDKNVNFITDPVPMHTVKSPDGGKLITVINAKYVEGPDHLVGEIAIG